MKKILLLIMIVYFGLIVLMPKEQIIYTALNQANKQLVNFEIDDMSDYGFYEDIDGLTVIYDKMRVAKVENIKLMPFIFYNKATVTSVLPMGSFKSMLDVVIYKASLSQMIISPLKVSISADTSIGKIDGDFDISSSKLKIFLKPNKNFNSFKYKKYFKKQEGGYLYESVIR